MNGFVVCGSHHVYPPPYLNTVAEKNISLLIYPLHRRNRRLLPSVEGHLNLCLHFQTLDMKVHIIVSQLILGFVCPLITMSHCMAFYSLCQSSRVQQSYINFKDCFTNTG